MKHVTMLMECGIDKGSVWTDATGTIFISVCVPLSNTGVQVTSSSSKSSSHSVSTHGSSSNCLLLAYR